MFHVRERLTELPEHMELDKLYSWLKEEDDAKYLLREEGGLDVSDMNFDPFMSLHVKAKNLIREFLITADEDIEKKINDLVRQICHNVSILYLVELCLLVILLILFRYFRTFKNLSMK